MTGKDFISRAALAGAFAFCAAAASAENITVTTYYPAPYGGYNRILTTGETVLARDGDFVTVGKHGDAADKLLVNGNTKLGDLFVLNTGDVYVKIPRPPAGKTLSWEPILIGTEIDQYQATGDYPNAPHSDTCNGDPNGAYTCPAGVKKSCVDVQKTQGPSCVWGGWNNNAMGISDTCNSRDHTYDACTKTCTDVDCVAWGPLGKTCLNHSWRSITYTPPKYRDVNVTCTTTETVMVLLAK